MLRSFVRRDDERARRRLHGVGAGRDDAEHFLDPSAERGDRILCQHAAAFLRQHGVALVLKPMALGDVLMRRHPAAALHWLPGDADQVAIGQLVDAARNALG